MNNPVSEYVKTIFRNYGNTSIDPLLNAYEEWIKGSDQSDFPRGKDPYGKSSATQLLGDRPPNNSKIDRALPLIYFIQNYSNLNAQIPPIPTFDVIKDDLGVKKAVEEITKFSPVGRFEESDAEFSKLVDPYAESTFFYSLKSDRLQSEKMRSGAAIDCVLGVFVIGTDYRAKGRPYLYCGVEGGLQPNGEWQSLNEVHFSRSGGLMFEFDLVRSASHTSSKRGFVLLEQNLFEKRPILNEASAVLSGAYVDLDDDGSNERGQMYCEVVPNSVGNLDSKGILVEWSTQFLEKVA